MSEGMVTEDRIAALVAAAKEGRLDEEATTQRKAPVVRRMSFEQPTKFTHDQQRRLRRIHDTFCRRASNRLGGELRVGVDCDVIAMTQHTWGNAHAELPASSICAVLEVEGAGTRLLLAGELGLAIALIELMLGGTLERVPRERRLSDIDWALTRRVFGEIAEDLSLIWQDSAGVALRLVGFETQADSAELSLLSEPTLAITTEVRIARLSSTLTFMVPWRSIDPVADQLSGTHGRESAPALEARRRMSHALADVEVQVRAEVGGLEMSLARIASLAPGDLIEFDSIAEQGVALFAGGAPIGTASPGQHAGRRAVQVNRPEEDGA